MFKNKKKFSKFGLLENDFFPNFKRLINIEMYIEKRNGRKGYSTLTFFSFGTYDAFRIKKFSHPRTRLAPLSPYSVRLFLPRLGEADHINQISNLGRSD